MKNKIKNYLHELNLLINSVPTLLFTLFILSIFSMNLLANKSINLPVSWLALDCGIVVSWFVFLTMDIITKHFGPKAATTLSILGTLLNLIFCLVFYIISVIPGVWSESYSVNNEVIINSAINKTFSGTWYVILGSAIAFIVSAFVNNFTNFFVGKIYKKNPDSLFCFITRTYISTALGQFTDNFVFSIIVSRTFFGWTILQCVMCAITGMLAELLFEAIFSSFGYKICQKWQQNGVGKEYFNFRLEKK